MRWVGVVGIVVCLLVFAPAALARGGWTGQRVPDPAPADREGSVLTGVSCTAPGACTAVGLYGHDDNLQAALAERWDGSGWSVQYPPSPDGTSGVLELEGVSCTAARICIAVGGYGASGRPLAERWDGSTWTIQPTPNPLPSGDSRLRAVSCATASFCMAVGQSRSTTTASATYAPLAERWNGSAWTLQPMSRPTAKRYGLAINGVSCTSPSACIAVGGSTRGPLAERWNGSRWSVQRIPGKGDLSGVSCVSANWCIAVVGRARAGQTPTLVERWNGKRWQVQRTPNAVGPFKSVSCTSKRACMAVGSQTWAERWNGKRWSRQRGSDRAAGDFYYGVSCPTSRDCEAVGQFAESSEVFSIAERWTG
jgi:hypothetical protein